MQLPFEFKSNPLAYSLLLTHVHFFLVLFLLSKKPMGRYRLAQELSLTPALTRTFLTKLQQKNLLKVNDRRRGHGLTSSGQELLQRYLERFMPLDQNLKSCDIVIGETMYMVLLKGKFFRPRLTVLELRDQAIRQRAISATVLEVSKEGLVFAQSNPADPFYLAKLEEEKERLIYYQNPRIGDWVLLVGAENFHVAREAAIRGALFATRCEEILNTVAASLQQQE